jgi:uncharacterized protein (DUF1778 family)
MTATKDSRLHVRLSSEQHALIRHAAEAEGKNLTATTGSEYLPVSPS